MMQRFGLGGLVIVLGVALMPPCLEAQEARGDEWRFSATPWLWLVKMDGTMEVAGREFDVEMDTDEIFDALEFAFMLHLEAGKGNLGIFAQPFFAWLAQDGTVQVPTAGPIEAEVDLDMVLLDLGGAYRIAGPLEIVGGARYSGLDITLALDELGAEETRDSGRWNGFVGARVREDFAERWGVMLHGDVGFGESESNYMTQGVLQYRFSPSWGIDLGYKWLHDEAVTEPRTIDVETDMYGAVMGVTYRH